MKINIQNGAKSTSFKVSKYLNSAERGLLSKHVLARYAPYARLITVSILFWHLLC